MHKVYIRLYFLRRGHSSWYFSMKLSRLGTQNLRSLNFILFLTPKTLKYVICVKTSGCLDIREGRDERKLVLEKL